MSSEILMRSASGQKRWQKPLLTGLAALALVSSAANAAEGNRDTFILTSTNLASGNSVAVFKLVTSGTPSLSLVNLLPTGGAGGAAGNAGGLQFSDDRGAVVNYGSNTVTKLARKGGSIALDGSISLSKGCVNPLSVALTEDEVLIAGTNCAEGHFFNSGALAGTAVSLPDTSAGQIAVGRNWSAVTLKSGSVLNLPLTARHSLAGTSSVITLPAGANNTPFGAAFWGDTLGVVVAHSPNSFAVIDSTGDVYPVLGPQPAFPSNAPCWLAKGPGNVWYSGNTPGHAVSIFFSDSQGGVFYKSVPVPGAPTDITVSEDRNLLAVIYTASDGTGGRIAVFSIDSHGDLKAVATSDPIGVAGFNGVGISQ